MEERARTRTVRQALSQVKDTLKELISKSENNAYGKFDVEAVYRGGQEQGKITTAAWTSFTLIAKRENEIFQYIGDETLKAALGEKWFEELAKQREGE